ncbi:MAG: ATP synthase F0 subunit B [Vicinamibacterales bacterium]
MIPDLSTLWVVALFILCVFVVNSLIFSPILAVSEKRSRAIRDARELADAAAQKAATASQDFDRTLATARAEVYGQMDQARRTALDKRAALLTDARREVEASMAGATTALSAQTTAARAALEREATNLAGEIVSRVLGRTA